MSQTVCSFSFKTIYSKNTNALTLFHHICIFPLKLQYHHHIKGHRQWYSTKRQLSICGLEWDFIYSQMLPAKTAYFSLDCKLGEDIFKPIHQHFSAEFLYTVSAVYFSLDTSLCWEKSHSLLVKACRTVEVFHQQSPVKSQFIVVIQLKMSFQLLCIIQ